VVTAIGDRFFVLDGHHRLDAYHRARWKGHVPVRHFKGTLKEAEATALRLNVKNKLPMTRNARSEAAWRMIVAGAEDATWKRTQKEIMNTTLASKSTVKRMARALRELGKEALDMTWAEVRRRNFQEDLDAMDDEGMDAWKKEKARKLADYLVKGPSLIKDPVITAMALKMVSEMLPELLADQWREEVLELALDRLDAHAPAEARRAIEEAIFPSL
jgi:hypothetical protein